MVVQHNLQAMNTNRFLGIAANAQASSSEKLASGYKINRAADDAAGLSISEKMRNQIRGLNKASSNAQDGVSLIQTAEGALDEVHSMLQRMSELAVQAANGTNQSVDRQALQNEVAQLGSEITRIAKNTEYNKMTLLSGHFMGGTNMVLHVGANRSQLIKFSIGKMTAGELKVAKGQISISTFEGAEFAICAIQNAIQSVSDLRSKLGAIQNRLEHTIANLDNVAENLQDAESGIRDTDMADEMVTYSKNNIIQQAAQSMLAQANQSTQGVLSLLQ